MPTGKKCVKMNENEFKDMPFISDKAYEHMKEGFQPYLMYETVDGADKTKTFTCTSCGKEFKNGNTVIEKTVTPETRALWSVKHKESYKCPYCGVEATAINTKILNIRKLDESKFTCIFLENNRNDVWIRCFEHSKTYKDTKNNYDLKEWMRYRLQPGKAEFWERCKGEWSKGNFREAFTWNFNYYHEKHYYEFYGDNFALDDTFLKYHSFGYYEGVYGENLPAIKYLCWYAIHPQIEMLSKLQLFDVLNKMIYGNTDDKSILNWQAKKPWELFGLSKQLYDIWRSEYYGDMNVLKCFKALHGATKKDFTVSADVLNFSSGQRPNLKKAKKLISLSRRLNFNLKDAIKYCEKKANILQKKKDTSFPEDYTKKAFEMWLDYLNMAELAGNIKTVSVFPSNLKAAHDSFLIAANYAKEKKNLEKLKREAVATAAPIIKKFPKVEKIYKSIKNKYSYSNDKYAIIVPDGITDIVLDGMLLGHCTYRTDRYYDRISTNESYIVFLRKTSDTEMPWYTLEIEPGGTIRQKRTFGDDQLGDLDEAMPFLFKWQSVVAGRLNKSDRIKAQKSKILRTEGFEELRRTKKKINYGKLQGTLLVEALEKDLMEAEKLA